MKLFLFELPTKSEWWLEALEHVDQLFMASWESVSFSIFRLHSIWLAGEGSEGNVVRWKARTAQMESLCFGVFGFRMSNHFIFFFM